MNDIRRLGKIIGWMLVIFVLTGIAASIIMVIGVKIFPPAEGLHVALGAELNNERVKLSEQIVRAFTVSDFIDILSKKNMLALIVFSFIVGLAASSIGEKGRPFTQFLLSGSEVMIKAISYIMFYAPVGLAAYFAYFIGVFGPQLLGTYFRAILLYYPLTILYFFIGFSVYAYLAGRIKGVKTFWRNIIPASLTAFATGSSMATIPLNLESARKSGVPRDIREVVIPIGATIHMDGSCLSTILKIALLFGIFNMPFSGVGTILTAIGIAILSGTVMSGIPGGGFLGELVIITLYGFPPQAMPVISMIRTLVDPPATMVNAIGDNVAGMMLTRIINGRDWMENNEHL